jgi:hypothetical protein
MGLISTVRCASASFRNQGRNAWEQTHSVRRAEVKELFRVRAVEKVPSRQTATSRFRLEIAGEIPPGERLQIVVTWESSCLDSAWRGRPPTVRSVIDDLAGTAGSKVRPALVLLDTGDFAAAPITSQARHSDYDVTLEDWRTAGLNAMSYVRVHKLNVVAKADIVRPWPWCRSGTANSTTFTPSPDSVGQSPHL